MLRDLYEKMTREQLIKRAVELDERNDLLQEVVKAHIEKDLLTEEFEALKEKKFPTPKTVTVVNRNEGMKQISLDEYIEQLQGKISVSQMKDILQLKGALKTV